MTSVALPVRTAPFAACAAAALAAGIAVAVAPVYAVAAAVGIAFLLVAVRSLVAGVAALGVLSFLEQVPALATREVTVVKLLGAALALAWLVREAAGVGERRPRSVSRATLAVPLALVAWSVASAAWAPDAGTAIDSALRLAQGVTLMLLTVAAIRTPRHAAVVLGALVLGAVATVALGFAFPAPVAHDQWGDLVRHRFGGLTGDPNEFGAQLVAAVAVAFFVALSPVARRWRIAGGAGALLALAGIGAAASRGAVLGLIVALLATPLVARRMRGRATVAIAVVALAALVLVRVTAGPGLAQRLTHFSDGGTGRVDLWRVAARMSEDHPLLGVGAGNFRVVASSYAGVVDVRRSDIVYDDPHVVHNTYLQFFAETGVVGGAAFLIAIGAAVLGLRSSLGRARGSAAVVRRATLVATLGYFACLFFISAAFEKELWILLGLCAAFPAIGDD
jgi:O-antigen ligase